MKTRRITRKAELKALRIEAHQLLRKLVLEGIFRKTTGTDLRKVWRLSGRKFMRGEIAVLRDVLGGKPSHFFSATVPKEQSASLFDRLFSDMTFFSDAA